MVSSQLEDELFHIAERTASNGRIDVQVTNVRRHSGRLHVTGELPNGSDFVESFEYPEWDHREYKFVRFVERAGYSLSAIGQLEGTYVAAEKQNNGWSFYAPKERRWWQSPITGRRDSAVNRGFLAWFLWSPLMAVHSDDELGDFLIGYLAALCHMAIFAGIIYAIWRVGLVWL